MFLTPRSILPLAGASLVSLATLPPSAVQAQSFYPHLAGQRYCELRKMGLDERSAVRAAMSEFWDSSRKDYPITVKGKEVTVDVAAFVSYIDRNCP